MPHILDVIHEPELYDIFNGDYTNDLTMYKTIFTHYNTVLELGVGTGRLAIPLAEQGINIIGVDNSKEMLGFLEEKLLLLPSNISKRIKIINQDFCDLEIIRGFECAFFPFCTFNYLLTFDLQKKALHSLRRSLSKGSIVIFDLMTLKTFPKMLSNITEIFYKEVASKEYVIRIYIQNLFDQSTQLLVQNRTYKYYKDNLFVGEKIVKMVNRITLLDEFKLLLKECGYSISHIQGDYVGNVYDVNSQCLVVHVIVD